MPTELFLNGMFNYQDPFFGFPLYIWGGVAALIIIGVEWLVCYYMMWKPLEPLHGIYYSIRDGTSCAFIFNRDLVGELVSERDAKCIFSYKNEIDQIDVPDVLARFLKTPVIGKAAYWLANKLFYYPTLYLDTLNPIEAVMYKVLGRSMDVEIAKQFEGGDWEQSAAVICAGVPVEIILDMGRWTVQNSPQHRAIENYCRFWNQQYPNDQIHSYMKFQKYLMSGKLQKVYPVPEIIRISDTVPWQRIDAAFPLNFDPNEYAGKIRQMAVDIENESKSPFNKYAIYILAGCFGFGIIIWISRLVVSLL